MADFLTSILTDFLDHELFVNLYQDLVTGTGGKNIYRARQTHKDTNIERHGQIYGGRHLPKNSQW